MSIDLHTGIEGPQARLRAIHASSRGSGDRKPPLAIQLGGVHYDTIGRYLTAGARVRSVLPKAGAKAGSPRHTVAAPTGRPAA